MFAIIFPHANLRRANLRGADLRWADLSGADLHGANLCWPDLSGANLRGADLRGANLREANLRAANLRGADLRWADLRGADLHGANLRGAEGFIARCQRSDGYDFTGVASEAGPYIVQAGCRKFTDAEYRAHVAAEYPATDKAAETLVILDFIATRAKQLGYV